MPLDFPRHAGKRAVHAVLIAALLSSSLSPAYGQSAAPVVVPPLAPTSPTTSLDVTAAGTPIVNIAAPDGSGTSHNVYDRFSVGKEGMIVNNSPSVGQSTIGGFLLANPNLAGRAGASLILNEVTGSVRTTLSGPMEVFGAKAAVVLANPNGITCDGCGFINMSRVSLVAGSVQLRSDGGLSGFAPSGDVAVEGQGLLGGNVDYFDIVGAAAHLNASLYAKDLVIAAGNGRFDYASRASAAGAAGSPTGIVLDSSLLGGMYANRIRLIGTGNGVGINLAGTVAALDGPLSISADGAITLAKTMASGDAQIASTNAAVSLSDQTYAGGSLVISAGSIRQSGGFAGALGSVTLSAARDASFSGSGIYAGLDGSGYLSGTSGLAIATAGTLDAGTATFAAGGAVSLEAGAVAQASGGQIAGKGITLVAPGLLTIAGNLLSSADLRLSGDAIDLTGAATAQGALTLSGRQVTLSGSATGLEAATGSATDSFSISDRGAWQSNGTALLSAPTLAIAGHVVGSGSVALTADRLATSGSVQAGDSLAIDTRSDAALAGSLVANNRASLAVGGAVSITGSLAAAKALDIEAGRVAVSGSAEAGAALAVTSRDAITASGTAQFSSIGPLSLSAAGALVIDGRASTNAAASLAGSQVDISGLIKAIGGLTLQAATLTLSGKALTSGDLAAAATQSAGITGTISASGRLNLTAPALTTGATGQLLAGQSVAIKTAGTFSHAGTLSGAGVTVAAEAIGNAGVLISTRDLTMTAQTELLQSGTVQAAGELAFSTPSLALNGTSLGAIGGGNAGVSVHAASVTFGATADLESGSALDLATVDDLTVDGKIVALGTISIQTAGGFTQKAAISGNGAIDLAAGTSLVHTGSISGGGALSLTAPVIANSGAITSSDTLSLAATRALTSSGSLLANNRLSLAAATVSLDGTIATNGLLSLMAPDLNMTGKASGLTGISATVDTLRLSGTGALQSGSALTLRLASLDNQGVITSASALDVSARNQFANSGKMMAGTSLTLVATAELASSGLLQAGTDLGAAAGGTLSLSGSIFAEGNASLHGASLVSAGDVAAKGNLILAGTTSAALAAGSASYGGLGFTLTGANVTALGRVQSDGAFALNAGQAITLGGSAQARGAVDLVAGTSASVTGTLLSGGTFSLTAPGVSLPGQILANDTVAITARSSDLSLAGTIQAAKDVTLTAVQRITIGTAPSAATASSAIANSSVATSGGGAGHASLAPGGGGSSANASVASGSAATAAFALTVPTLAAAVPGSLASSGSVSLSAADIDIYGAVAAKGDISALTSHVLSVQGSVWSDGALAGTVGSLAVGSATRSGASLAAAGPVAITTVGDIANLGTIASNGGDLTLTVGGGFASGGILAAKGALTVGASGDYATAGTVSAGSIAITARDIALSGVTLGIDGLSLSARSLTANAGSDTQSGGALSLRSTAGTSLAGKVLASSALTIRADTSVAMLATSDVQAGGAATLTAKGDLTAATGSALASLGALSISAAEMNLDGTLVTNGRATLSATGGLTAHGTLSVSGSASLNATGPLLLGGTLVSAGGLSITGGKSVIGAGALVQAGDAVHVEAASLTSNASLVGAHGIDLISRSDLVLGGTLMAGIVDASGAATSLADLSLHATGVLSFTGSASVTRNATLTAGDLLTVGGSIAGLGDVRLSGARVQADTHLQANGALSIDAAGSVALAGSLSALNGLGVTSGTTLVNGGALRSNGAVTLLAGGDATQVSGASIGAVGDITMRGAAIDLAGAVVGNGALGLQSTGAALVRGDGSVTARRLDLLAGGDVQLGGALVAGDALRVSASGTLAIAGTSTLRAGATDAEGAVVHVGTIDLAAGGTIGNAGAIISTGTLTFKSPILVSTGTIWTGTDIDLAAQSLSLGGTFRSLGAASARTTGGAFALSGSVEAQSIALSATGGDLTLGTGARVAAFGAGGEPSGASLSSDQAIASLGTIASNGAVVLRARGTIDIGSDGNGSTPLYAVATKGTLTLDAGGALRSVGTLMAGGDLAVSASSLTAKDLTSTGLLSATTSGPILIDGAAYGGTGVMLNAKGGSLSVGSAGSVRSLGAITLTATGDLDNAGQIVAGSDDEATSGATIDLTSGGTLTSSGAIIARTDRLTLSGQSVALSGTLAGGAGTLARKDLLIAAGHVTLDGETVGATGGVGAVTVAADGITFGAAAQLKSGGNLTVSSVADLTTMGSLLAVGATSVSSQSALVQDARITGGSSVSLSAATRLDQTGTVSGAGPISLSASILGNSGTIESSGSVGLAATTSLITSGSLTAGGALNLAAPVLSLSGTVATNDRLGIAAPAVTIAGKVSAIKGVDASIADLGLTATGSLQTGGDLTLDLATLDNRGLIAATKALALSTTGSFANAGQMAAGTALQIVAEHDLASTGLVQSGGALAITATGAAELTGTLSAGGNATIAAARVLGSGTIASQDVATFTVGGDLILGSGATLYAKNGISLTAANVTAGGTVQSDGTLAANATQAITLGGSAQARGAVDLVAGTSASVTGTLLSGGTFSLTAPGVSLPGQILANDTVAITARSSDLSLAGTMQAAKDVTLTAVQRITIGTAPSAATASSAIANSSVATSGGGGRDASLAPGGGGSSANASVASGSAATAAFALTVPTLAAAVPGSLASSGSVSLSAADIDIYGAVAAKGDISALTSHVLSVQGSVWSDGALTGTVGSLAVGSATRSGASLAAAGPVAITTVGDIANLGTIASNGGDLTLTVGGGFASGGILSAKGALTVGASGDYATAGTVSAGSIAIEARDIALSGITLGIDGLSLSARSLTANAGSDTQSGGALSLRSTAGTSLAGKVLASSALTIRADTSIAMLATSDVQAGGAATLTAKGDMTAATGSALASLGALSLSGAGLVLDGRIGTNGALDVQAASSLALSGNLSARGAVRLASDASLSFAGTLVTDGNLALLGGATSLGGTIKSTADVVLTAGSLQLGGELLTNGALTIRATGDMSMAAGSAPSETMPAIGASLSAGGALDISTSGKANLLGEIRAVGSLSIAAQRDLATGGLIASNAAIALSGDHVAVGGSVRAGAELGITAASLLDGSGALTSGWLKTDGGGTTLHAASISYGGTVNAKGSVSVSSTGGDLSLTGAVDAHGAVSIDAGGALELGALNADGALVLTAAGNATANGAVSATGEARLTAASASLNVGLTVNGATHLITTGGDLTIRGPLSTLGTLDLESARDLDIAGTTIANGVANASAGRDVLLSGSLASHQAASVTAGGTLSLASGSALVVDTANGGTGAFTLTAGSLDNAGIISAAANATGTVAGAVQNRAGAKLLSGGALSLSAASLATFANSILASNGSLSVNLSGTANLDGHVGAQATLGVVADGITIGGARDAASGLGGLQAGGTLTLTSRSGDVTSLTGASVLGGAGVSIDAAAGLTLGGDVRTNGAARLTAGQALATNASVSALGGLTLTGRSLALGGTVSAGGDFSATAQGSAGSNGALDVSGALGATGKLTLIGGATALTGTASLASGDQLTLAAASLTSAAALSGGRGIALTVAGNAAINGSAAAGTVDTQGRVVSTGALALTAGGAASVSGSVSATGDAVVTAGTSLVTTGRLTSLGDVRLSAATLALGGPLTANGTFQVKGTGDVQLSGTLVGLGSLSVDGGSLTTSGALGSNGAIDLTAAAAFSQSDSGSIGGIGNVTLKGRTLDLAGTIASDAALALTATGGSATIAAGASLRGATARVETAGDTQVAGSLVGKQTLSTTTAGTLTIAAGGTVQAGTSDANGAVATVGTLSLGAGSAIVNAGLIASTGGLTLSAPGLVNSGTISTGTDVDLTAASLDLGGTFASRGDIRLRTTAGAFKLSGGLEGQNVSLRADGGDLLLAGGSHVTAYGTGDKGLVSVGSDHAISALGLIAANNDIALTAGQGITIGPDGNAAKAVSTKGAITLTAGGTVATTGSVVADGTITIAAASLDSHGLSSGGLLKVDTAGAITLAGTSYGARIDLASRRGDITIGADASVASIGAISINAAGDLANAGSIAAGSTVAGTRGGTIDLVSGGALRSSGGIVSNNDTVGLTGSTITLGGALASGGGVYAAGGLGLKTATLTLSAGAQVVSDAALSFSGSALSLASGSLLQSNKALDITLGANGTSGQFSSGGSIVALSDLTLRVIGGTLDNQIGGGIFAGGSGNSAAGGVLTLEAGTIANAGSIVATASGTGHGGALSLIAPVLTNSGAIHADGTLSASGGSLSLTGAGTTLESGGAIDLHYGAVSIASGATLQGAGRLDSTGTSFVNAGTVKANGDVAITTSGALGSSGLLSAGGALTLNAGGALGLNGRVSAKTQLSGTGDTVSLGGTIQASSASNPSGASATLRATGGAIDVTGALESSGALTLTAAGAFTASSSAAINGASGITISADTIAIADPPAPSLSSHGNVVLSSAHGLTLGGGIVADGAITLTDGDHITLESTSWLAAGLPQTTAAITTSGIALSAPTLTVQGSIAATGGLALTTRSLALSGTAQVNGDVTLAAWGGVAPTLSVANGGALVSALGDIRLGTLASLDVAGTVRASAGSISLNTPTMNVAAGGQIAAGTDLSVTLADGGRLTIDGQLLANRDIALSGGTLAQGSAGRIHAGRDLTFSTGDARTAAGPVAVNGQVYDLTATPLSATIAGTVKAGRNLSLTGPGTILLTETSEAVAGNDASLSAGHLLIASAYANGRLGLIAGHDLTIGTTSTLAPGGLAKNGLTLDGSIQAGNDLSVNASGEVTSSAASQMVGGHALRILGSALALAGYNSGETLVALTATGATPAGVAPTVAPGDISLAGATASNGRVSLSAGTATITGSGSITTHGGMGAGVGFGRDLGAVAAIDLETGGTLTNAGTIWSDGLLFMKSAGGNIVNAAYGPNGGITAGTIISQTDSGALVTQAGAFKGNNVALYLGVDFANSGAFLPTGNWLISARTISNYGLLGASGNLTLSAGGDFYNVGTIFAGNKLTLTAGGALTNDYSGDDQGGGVRGLILAEGDISIRARDVVNQSATIQSLAGSIDIGLSGGSLTNTIKVLSIVEAPGSGFLVNLDQPTPIIPFSSDDCETAGGGSANPVVYHCFGPLHSGDRVERSRRIGGRPGEGYDTSDTDYTYYVGTHVAASTGTATIAAAGNISIASDYGDITNRNSSILAGGDITIRTSGTVHNNADLLTSVFTDGSTISFGNTNISDAPTRIQAGGTLSIQATLDNASYNQIGGDSFTWQIEHAAPGTPGNSGPGTASTGNNAAAGTGTAAGANGGAVGVSGNGASTSGASGGTTPGSYTVQLSAGAWGSTRARANAVSGGGGASGATAGFVARSSGGTVASYAPGGASSASSPGGAQGAALAGGQTLRQGGSAATAAGAANGSATLLSFAAAQAPTERVGTAGNAAGGADALAIGSRRIAADGGSLGGPSDIGAPDGLDGLPGGPQAPTDPSYDQGPAPGGPGIVTGDGGAGAIDGETAANLGATRLAANGWRSRDGVTLRSVSDGGAGATGLVLVDAQQSGESGAFGGGETIASLASVAGGQAASLAAAGDARTPPTADLIAAFNGSTLPTLSAQPFGTFLGSFLAAFNLTGNAPSLFTYSANQGSASLYTSNAALASEAALYDSAWFFARVAPDRATTYTRLGDGFFDALLVSRQVQAASGTAQLPQFGSALDQYEGLLKNALAEQGPLGLQLGVALTGAQVAQLTAPILWYVRAEVQGRSVLVPVLYLSASDPKAIVNGALLGGTNVLIAANGGITNSGTIKASQIVALAANGGDLINAEGGTIVGGSVIARSANDIVLRGGSSIVADGSGTFTLPDGSSVTGGVVSLTAGRDIVSSATVSTQRTVSVAPVGPGGTSSSYTTQERVTGAAIRSSTATQLAAGNDIRLNAATLASQGATALVAGGNVTLDGTTARTVTQETVRTGKYSNSVATEQASTFTGTSVTAGGPITIAAQGGTLSMTGATIKTSDPAKGTIDLFGRDGISIASAEETASLVKVEQTGKRSSIATNAASTTNHLTTIDAAGALTVTTPGALTLAGAALTSDKALTVDAGSVAISGVIDSATNEVSTFSKKSGFLSSKTTTTHSLTTDQTVVASTLSGDTVQVTTQGGVSLLGADLVASNGLTISAGGPITIGALAETDSSSQSKSVKKSGVSLSGGGLFLGVAKSSTTVDTTTITNVGSLIGTSNGALTIASNDALKISASSVAAGGDVLLAGRSIDIVHALDVTDTIGTSNTSSIGISTGVNSQLIQSASNLVDATKIATSSGNDRVKAVAGLAAGMSAVNTVNAAKDLGSALSKGGDLGVSAGVNFGISKSSSTDRSHDETVVGSQVTGANVTLLATGQGARGTIDITGSKVATGGDLTLAGQGPITISAAQETDRQSGTAKSSGFKLGVNIELGMGKKGLEQVGGPTVSVSASSAKSSYAGTDVTEVASSLTAGGTAKIVTPGALIVDGSTVAGSKVVADVGSLAIASRQDTSTYNAQSKSSGVSVRYTIGTGQLTVSGNVASGKQTGDFASVETQAGIKAGTGGFDIKVAGNTDLKGAVIASEAEAAKNRLTTATLTASDIENRESYSASQIALSGGLGFATGKDAKTGANRQGQVDPNGATKLPGVKIADGVSASAGVPIALSDNGSQSGTTRSAIAPGTILITSGDAASEQTAQTISRDTGAANDGALTQQFTAAKREEIAQGFQAAQILATETNAFLSSQAKKADQWAKDHPSADPKTNPYGTWRAGGAGNLALTALSGAASGNVSGSLGSLAEAAAVKVLQGLATNKVKEIADSFSTQTDAKGNPIPNAASETVRSALQALTACAGNAVGASGDCGGAAMGAAASVVLNNLLSTGTTTAADGDGNPLTAQAQEARENLVATIVVGIASAIGLNANAAQTGAQIETTQNSTTVPGLGLLDRNTPTGYNAQLAYAQDSRFKELVDRLGGDLPEVLNSINTCVRSESQCTLTADQQALLREYNSWGASDAGKAAIASEAKAAQARVAEQVAQATKGDLTYVGNKEALTSYLANGGTLSGLQAEKAAFVSSSVQGFIGDLDLSDAKKNELLAEFASGKVSAPDVMEQAYRASVGFVAATVGEWAAPRTEQLADTQTLLNMLPVTGAGAVLNSLIDFGVQSYGDQQITKLQQALGVAEAAGLRAAIAERNKANPVPDGEFRIDSIDGRTVFTSKPALGDPSAGANYQASRPEHQAGFDGEVRLAQVVHNQPGQFVVSYGNGAGMRGEDVVSVDAEGNVYLWDNKVRNNPTTIQATTTFKEGSNSLANARRNALNAIAKSALPDEIKLKATDNLSNENFTAITVGDGTGSRNSVVDIFRNGEIKNPGKISVKPISVIPPEK